MNMFAEALPQGMLLADLLAGIVDVPANANVMVRGVNLDSRAVVPGDVFFACAGHGQHGLQHVAQAEANGAVAVVWEPADNILPASRLPAIAVPALSQQLGAIAARFFGQPGNDLHTVGVTGTNGKTSVAHLLAQAWHNHGSTSGLMGTLGYGVFGDLLPSTHTTPDALRLHRWLAVLRQRQVGRVVMEVSSHGLAQGRVGGLAFELAIFTNLSRDHLDYHGDMTSYGAAKQRLFNQLPSKAALINSDDAFGQKLLAELPASVDAIAYGLQPTPKTANRYLMGRALQLTANGIRLQISSSWGDGELHSNLLGQFNAYNLLAVLGALLHSEVALADALELVAQLTPPPGRLEVYGGAQQPTVVVDYAHTPDALEAALTALRPHATGKLICVFGCGGDRDTGKRPFMGSIAAQYADVVIVTDDNPRSENPADITQAILAGIEDTTAVSVEHDRAQAIRQAVNQATAGDVVLVAGKGHEDYQLVGDQQLAFSDRDFVSQLLGGADA